MRFLSLFLLRAVPCLTCLAPIAVLAAENERVFSVRGIIRGAYEDGAISIQHEAIPNFMPAMTMPFYTDADEVKGLAPGDRVQFEFRVGERSRATKFRKLAGASSPPLAASPSPSPSPSPHASSAIPPRRLRVGDVVPAFSLVDQNSRAITDADLRGRRTIVTFVFTRCPVPEFCPLIATKFQALQSQLKRDAKSPAAPDVQLLSISIDPAHDRPAVLRAHGAALGADFSRWKFATGEAREVEKLTRAFAVRTELNGGRLDHTLATALIGTDGRVTEIWRGNAWKPEEIAAKLAQPEAMNRSPINAPITTGR